MKYFILITSMILCASVFAADANRPTYALIDPSDVYIEEDAKELRGTDKFGNRWVIRKGYGHFTKHYPDIHRPFSWNIDPKPEHQLVDASDVNIEEDNHEIRGMDKFGNRWLIRKGYGYFTKHYPAFHQPFSWNIDPKPEHQLVDPTDVNIEEDDEEIRGTDKYGEKWIIRRGSPYKTYPFNSRPPIWNIFPKNEANDDNSPLAYLSNPKLAKNLEIFDWVSDTLKRKLGGSPAPAYRIAYDRWNQKKSNLRSKVASDSQAMEKMLDVELRRLGLSHLGFQKVRRIHLGIVTESKGNNKEEIIKVCSNSPAAKAGLKPKDVLIKFDGKPVSSELIRQAYFSKRCTVQIAYYPFGNEENLVVKDVKFELPEYYPRTLGMTLKGLGNGSVIVEQILHNSPSFRTGIRKGTKIIRLGNEPAETGSRKFLADQTIELQIVQPDGEEKKLVVEVSNRGDLLLPSSFEIPSKDNMKIVYFRVSNFGPFYDPILMHQTMVHEKDADLFIIDLQDNLGGRADHLLSYFLAPGSKIQFGYDFNAQQQFLDTIPERVNSEGFDHWNHLKDKWFNRVNADPIPIKGKVAFILNENTSCAAELCPQILLEYQELREQKSKGHLVYKNELYPKAIAVFGKTKGRFQFAGEETFFTDDLELGDFRLFFPAGEIATAIMGNKIENVGIEGLSNGQIANASNEHNSAIEQAIEWARGKAEPLSEQAKW